MARLFNGTTDFMNSSIAWGGGPSQTVLSFSFWLWQNAFDNNDEIVAELTANFNLNPGAFLINPNSAAFSGTFQFSVLGQNIGDYLNNSFARPSAGAWHHYVLVLNTGTTPGVAYVDGISQSVTTTVQGAGGNSNFGNGTIYLMSRGGVIHFNSGRLAEFAFWTIALSQADATALAAGAIPTTIKINRLTVYTKICGVTNPEPEIEFAGMNWPVTGTTQIAHPPAVAASCGATGSSNISILKGPHRGSRMTPPYNP
jgi:hypothetical protein